MPVASTAATTGDPPDPPGAPTKGRLGRLLALVRKLIDYGRELTATLQRDPASRPRQFGTGDIALILARIAQGLNRARALEERLVRNAGRLTHRPGLEARPPRTGRAAHSSPPRAVTPTLRF
jgi:hypothetical protein